MEPEIIFEPGQFWVLGDGRRWTIGTVKEEKPEAQNDNHAAVNGSMEIVMHGKLYTVSPSWARSVIRQTGALLVTQEIPARRLLQD